MSKRAYQNGTKCVVNMNSEAVIIGYDSELDMYEVRLWQSYGTGRDRGKRHIGDVVVPIQSIKEVW